MKSKEERKQEAWEEYQRKIKEIDE